MVAVGLLLAVVAGALVTGWLLDEASAGTKVARLRMDAMRTGLTVVAGSGGAAALLLAARRQWLSERAQKHLEASTARDQEHARQVQEHVAATAKVSEEDALQRRLSELFTNGVEQLGNAHASIKLGGLYTLERLVQQNPQFRQIVVDVLCGYLRMELVEDETANGQSSHEITVRQAVQVVLTSHLRDDHPDTYWPDLRLNLCRAHLYSIDATGAAISEADFAGAIFHGGADFSSTHFSTVARFRGIHLESGTMSFIGARFEGAVDFDTAVIAGEVVFDRAEALDRNVTIGGRFRIRDATVSGNVTMKHVTFHNTAHFDRSAFAGVTRLSSNKFTRNTSFHHTHFNEVDFRKSLFQGITSFNAAKFDGDASFEGTQFGEALNFTGARFKDSVRFDGAELTHRPYFQGTHASGDHIREWPPGCREVETAAGEVTIERVTP